MSSGLSQMLELLLGLSPLVVVILGGLLLMISESVGKRGGRDEEGGDVALGTFITLAAGAVASVAVWSFGPERLSALATLQPYLILDRFTLFFFFVLSSGGALAALLAGGYLPEHRLSRGEFYPLITFSVAGAMALAASGDFLSLFVSLETMSLGVYCLTGFRRGSARSTEAAVKYFLLGSFAAALTIYGAALIYGATGSTAFVSIRGAVTQLVASPEGGKLPVFIVGMALVIVGLAFKVSAVPFHMWTPDVYEGAPTPATSFMAVCVKSAAFAVLLRVALVAFGDRALLSWGSGWPPLMAGLAILTMTVANLIAGRQESVKRMLAYSSIAHAGYLLVGLASNIGSTGDAQASILFYLFNYTFATIGAFGALIYCGSFGKEAVSFEDLAGLGRKHPFAAGALSLFLLSLAGVPPTSGFFSKLYIVRSALDADLNILAVVLLLNSVLAAYYYLKVLVYMYMRESAAGAPSATPMESSYVTVVLVVAAIFVVGIGLFPTTSLEMAVKAAL